MEGAGAGGWRELVVTRFCLVEMEVAGWGWMGMEGDGLYRGGCR